MKLLIDIPKEFEQNFQMDRFEDSLNRLSADAHLLAGNYEQELAIMLIEAFKNAVIIPPHGEFYNSKGFSCRNETVEHLKPYHPSFDKKGALLYRIALNIAEVADQLAEQNKYIIASPKEY